MPAGDQVIVWTPKGERPGAVLPQPAGTRFVTLRLAAGGRYVGALTLDPEGDLVLVRNSRGHYRPRRTLPAQQITERRIVRTPAPFAPLTPTHYVSATGNDNNAGTTPATAWKTVTKVNSASQTVPVGSVIAFEGGATFSDSLLYPGRDGVSFTSYGTGQAILSAGVKLTGWTAETVGGVTSYWTAATLANMGAVAIDDLSCREVTTQAAMMPGTFWRDTARGRLYIRTHDGIAPTAKTVEGSKGTDCIINVRRDVVIQNLHMRMSGGIGVQLGGAGVKNTRVEGCTFRHMKRNAVLVDGTGASFMEGVRVLGNLVHDVGGVGILVLFRGDDVLVADNRLYNTGWDLLGEDYTGAVRYVSGKDGQTRAKRVVFAYNYVENCGYHYTGTAGSSPRAHGVALWLDTPGEGSEAYGNTVVRALKSGVMVELGGIGLGIRVYDNTTRNCGDAGIELSRSTCDVLVSNNTDHGSQFGLLIQGGESDHISGTSGPRYPQEGMFRNRIVNNIFSGNVRAIYARRGGNNPGGTDPNNVTTHGGGNTFHNNALGIERAGMVEWGDGNLLGTYAAMAAASGAANLVPGDPLLISPAALDFGLAPASPARNKAALVAGINEGRAAHLGGVPYVATSTPLGASNDGDRVAINFSDVATTFANYRVYSRYGAARWDRYLVAETNTPGVVYDPEADEGVPTRYSVYGVTPAGVETLLKTMPHTMPTRTGYETRSTPLVISSGGTYTLKIRYTGSTGAAVRVTTTAPVVIRGDFVSANGVVESGADGTNITLERYRAWSRHPGVARPSGLGYAVSIQNPASLVVRQGFMVGFRFHVYALQNNASIQCQRFIVELNRLRNAEGRVTTATGYTDSRAFDVGHSIQTNGLRYVPEYRVRWNEIVQEPFVGFQEDIINFYKSSGTETNRATIHGNLVWGGYAPGELTDDVGAPYSGCLVISDGLIPQGGDVNSHGWLRIYGNTLLGGANMGIGIAKGKNIEVDTNYVMSAGRLENGVSVWAVNAGIYVWDEGTGGSVPYAGSFGPIHVHDNELGHYRPTGVEQNPSSPPYVASDFTPDKFKGGGTYTNNRTLSASETTVENEKARYIAWTRAQRSAGRTIGYMP